jgi:molecular chaperone DnaJ
MAGHPLRPPWFRGAFCCGLACGPGRRARRLRSPAASGQNPLPGTGFDCSSDPYGVLGVSRAASDAEIKAAYRRLVKRHHPDAGGDDGRILAINAAWEVLGDADRRRSYDQRRPGAEGPGAATVATGRRPARAVAADEALALWLRQVVAPIDRLLVQVIDPFAAELHALAADPYDDRLMEAFCAYLERSRGRLDRVELLYRSSPCPPGAEAFGLSLYHCLAQVKDALVELDRYTMGYVDSYLRDGREMLREAGQRLVQLQQERRRLSD